jgi:hypothetical protein
MKDLGMIHYFLGLEVWQRTDEILLSQGKYTVQILKKFGMPNCKPMATPMMTNLKKHVCLLSIPTRLIRPRTNN